MYPAFVACAVATGLFAQSVAADPPKLAYVVVLGRHGVRAPTAKLADLARYSSDPWPDFGVKPGELTPHGRDLMTLLGSWYRSWIEADSLLPPGCDAVPFIHVRADVGQRTTESGRAFAQGFAPGCAVELHQAAEDPDPLFHSAAAGLAKGDGRLAVAAVSGRIGDNPDELTQAYAPAFATLHRILLGSAATPAGKEALLPSVASISATDEGLADIRGAMRTVRRSPKTCYWNIPKACPARIWAGAAWTPKA